MGALWSLFGSSHSLSSVVLADEETEYDDDDATPAPFHANTLTLDALTYLEVGKNPFVLPLLERIILPHVETLHLESVPFRVVHRLISASADLDDLWLSDITSRPANSSHSPVALSALCTIYLKDCPWLLDHIHAPQLKSLHLNNSHLAANSGAPLRALIKRSSPELTSLRLQRIDIGDEEILGCLEGLPDLDSLSLYACTISDTVLRALAVPPSLERDTGWLLPRLKVFQCHQNAYVTPQAVIALLASRESSRKSPIKGSASFVDDLSDEDVETLSSRF
ncbi:hypothetical protein BOTBODRAFT_251559 [Botryobasidium botryosum FD-172 SS1]|uniref:F-box domain-containing protein n=1 Tax=Botryobasidium botryosum (strain FD-172 SS1) TaxID=930990 RepID=A0A067MLV0_BOTB1|nr:hypothetical protein BOTBODRAFT_251559 [Botryobasidium botryosum FD-172 SS1]